MKPFFLATFLLCFSASFLFAEAPPRVVSLSPALTELVWHLKSETALVGRSSACNYPEEVKRLPVAGNFAVPFLPKLVRLRTQILLSDDLQDPKAVSALNKAGIEVELLPLRNFDEYRAAVKRLGKLLDCEKASEAELARVERVLNHYAKHDTPRKKVLFLVWDKPMMAAGKRSHLSRFVALAGGENLGDAVDMEFFRCSREWVLKSGAEVIFFPGEMGRKHAVRLEGFESLPAVKNNAVYSELDSDLYFRLGPRFDRALAAISEILSR